MNLHKKIQAPLLIAITCTISGAPILQLNLDSFSLAFAAQASNAAKAKTDLAEDGLDASVRPLINRGNFAEAVRKLEEISSSDTTAGRNQAWQSFALLYLGKHNELREFAKKVKAMPANDKDPNAAAIVNAIDLTSQGKLDEADKVLSQCTEPGGGDLLLNFGKACVALKKGNPAKAAEYCEKTVGMRPDFAWGFRTLGFIQEKSLKNPALAERAYEHALDAEPSFRDVRDLLVDLRLARNDFDGAIATSNEAIKLYPKDANNYYRLSQIYTQQWRLIESLEQLKKAVALSKDEPRFYRSMANIYRYQGRLGDAIAEQKKAVELSKDKPFELIELATLYELHRESAPAVEALKEALKLSPANSIAHQKVIQLLKKENRTDELITEYKRQIEAQPKVAALRLALAEELRIAGKTDEAIEQLKEAANLEQKDPRPHRLIAKIELDKKNYSAAAKSYIRALNINPGSVEDLVALGFSYANNSDYMQAETAFTTGLALQQLGQTTGAVTNVNPFDIMRSLSLVLLEEGRYRDAIVPLEEVVATDKDPKQKLADEFMLAQGKALRDRNADSLKNLQAAFAKLDVASQAAKLPTLTDTLFRLGKNNEALVEIKKFPEADLKAKQPLILARAWVSENRMKEAQELVRKAIEEAKGDNDVLSDSYLELSRVLLADNDLRGAIDSLQKSVELNPKNFDAWVHLARLQLQDKKVAESQQSAQKALEVNPYCVPAYLVLGETNLSLGKLKDAESNFQKATELYPTSIDAHRGLLAVFQKQSKQAEADREQEIISQLSKNS
jgi:tetratricopeptide (TPR) repeat protein